MSLPLHELIDQLIDVATMLGRATNERDHAVLSARVSALREAILSHLPRPTRTLHEALNLAHDA